MHHLTLDKVSLKWADLIEMKMADLEGVSLTICTTLKMNIRKVPFV